MKRLALLFLAYFACDDAKGGECRPAQARRKTRQLVIDSSAVFATPVATVVVVSPPVLLYSYRAATKPAATPTITNVPGAQPPLSIDAEQLLRVNCMKCHQGDASKSGLPFFDLSGAPITPLPRRAILEAASPVADGATLMPPGETRKLTAEELDILRAWAEPPRDLRY
jgi:hypothetical protein